MGILTHLLEINSTSVGSEPTFTIHLVFASNLKNITLISLNLYIFIYFFPNIRSTFHRQLIHYWCHCYGTLINMNILFCSWLTGHWYSGCGCYCNYLIGCQWFSKLKWSASTAQLSRRILTNKGESSIFGAKDFQQRYNSLDL